MNRTVAYALGPELVWLAAFGLTLYLVAHNQPPTETGNQRLEHLGWLLTIGAVVLSFVPFAWAPGGKWWWLLRVALTGLIAIVIVSNTLCNGIDYRDSRNSGVGSALFVYVALGYVLIGAGAVIATIFLITKWRFAPFLKWSLIGLSAFVAFWMVIFWLASFAKNRSGTTTGENTETPRQK